MSGSGLEQATPFRVERDVVYGEGTIGHGTDRPGTRPLLMDVYLPNQAAPPGGRPVCDRSLVGR